MEDEAMLEATGALEAELKKLDLAQIGKLLLEYISESNHNGWDGYGDDEAAGVKALAEDMVLYAKNMDMANLSLYFGGNEQWDEQGKRRLRHG